MGILNVTPDSFSDGGRWIAHDQAVAHAIRLVEEGASVVDVGAESTRPGSVSIPLETEWDRLAPILLALKRELPASVLLSVDTSKPEIMRRAAHMGVDMINNVAGLPPKAVIEELRGSRHILAMHMHGTPATMHHLPLDASAAIQAVSTFFAQTEAALIEAGWAKSRIWLDPGIGFGKSDRGNIALLRELPRWTQHFNIAIGVSRKGFIGRALGIDAPVDRDPPTKMLEFSLALSGVALIRTHAPGTLRRRLDLL